MSIKNLVYYAAKLCAYVIGNGPLAVGLINTLKRQLTYEKNVSEDSAASLMALGYKRAIVARVLAAQKFVQMRKACRVCE